jgi:RimJ/RimL family protein N-acetyltransferase
VGRYFYLEQENLAEVAFVVRESKRGTGMATVLLCQMMQIAQKRGVGKMLAYVRRDNRAMLHIFENYEFIRQASDSTDEVVLCRMIEPDPQDPEPICEDA